MKTGVRQYPESPESVESPRDTAPSTSSSTHPPSTMPILSHRPKNKAPAAFHTPSLNPNLKAFVAEIGVRIRDLYKASGYNPIATDDQLRSLGVQLSTLSLDKGSAFVQPIPLPTMRAWLGETQPWKVISRGNVPYNRGEHFAYLNSKQRCIHLSSFGSQTCEGDAITNIRTRANYRRRMTRPAMTGRGMFWYDVEYVFHYADPACPHVSALLTEDMALPDAKLTLFELFVMMSLTNMRCRDGVVDKDGHIPITLISMGDCRARVLHGYFDATKKRIYLQVSKVLDFDKPGRYMDDDWVQLLCWSFAQPVIGGKAN